MPQVDTINYAPSTEFLQRLKGGSRESSLHLADAIAGNILKTFSEDEIRLYLSQSIYSDEYLQERYGNDPIGFCTKVLKFTYTQDVVRMMESVLNNPVTVAISGNSVGKCVAYGESIIDANGKCWTSEDLIGKKFYLLSVDKDLNIHKSRAYAKDNGLKSVVSLTTKTGRNIVRTTNHPLIKGIIRTETNYDKYGNRQRRLIVNEGWTEVEKFKPGDYVLMANMFPVVGKKIIPDSHVRILAYLIGDGSLEKTSVRFSQIDGPNLEEFRTDVESMGCELKLTSSNGHCTYRIYSPSFGNQYVEGNPVYKLIRDCGLWNKGSYDKFIPSVIWELDNKQVALFLNRLYSTDGWVSFNKKHKEVGYCSVSLSLCKGIQNLLSRFGIVSNIFSKRARWTHKGIKKETVAYFVGIYDATSIVRFRDQIGIYGVKTPILNSLVSKLEENGHKYIRRVTTRNLSEGFRWEKVVSVEDYGQQLTVAITVPGNETFLTPFVEHNTHSAASLSCWFLRCLPGSQVYTAAAPPAERNLKGKLWGEIRSIVISRPDVFNHYSSNILHVQDENNPKSFMVGVTIPTSGTKEEKEAKFSGAHAPNLLFVVDEGDAVPDEVYHAIDSCMSGGNSHLLIMFNPRQRSGEAFRKIKDGRANVVNLSVFNHPNVIYGDDTIIPGCVSREVTVRRINEWSDPVTDKKDISKDHCFQVPDFLVGVVARAESGEFLPPLASGWRRVTTPQLHYMVLGQYPPAAENQLIDFTWIKKARERYNTYVAMNGGKPIPPEGIRPIMGMDVADEGGDWNSVALRYGGFVPPIIKWRGIDVDMSALRATEIFSEVDARIAYIESDGLGAAVSPRMRREYYWKCHTCGKTFYNKALTGICPMCPSVAPTSRIIAIENPPPTMEQIYISAIKVMVGSAPSDNDSAVSKDLGQFGCLRDQLWWSLREWLRKDPTAMLPPSDTLEEDLLAMTFEVKNGKLKVTSKEMLRAQLGGRSPDEADALIETFYSRDVPRVRRLYD